MTKRMLYIQTLHIYGMIFLEKGVAVLTKENIWLKPNFNLFSFVEEKKVSVFSAMAYG